IVAAGDADQLADPADTGDQGFVPFLEVNARTAREQGGLEPYAFDMLLEFERVALGTVADADQRAKPSHIAQDAFHGAMIADPDLNAGFDQRLGDIGLDV